MVTENMAPSFPRTNFIFLETSESVKAFVARLCQTLWTAAHQTLLFMGLPCKIPFSGDPPHPGIESRSLVLQDFFTV